MKKLGEFADRKEDGLPCTVPEQEKDRDDRGADAWLGLTRGGIWFAKPSRSRKKTGTNARQSKNKQQGCGAGTGSGGLWSN